jgi:glutathione-regulated potassium-efflux system ancillary protein KefC
MLDLIWIGPALIFGFVATRLKMPPMVGYLIGGFILNIYGTQDPEIFHQMGNLGVTLLLFTIGLKLDIKILMKPYIWAGATLHTLAVVMIFGLLLFLGSFASLSLFFGINLMKSFLIAFALSFSSTVFAVKTLEEKGEMSSRHGQIAIGILIMQDIFAVVFLAVSTGKLPTIWALGLLLLIPGRYLLKHLMARAGNGELLILYGLGLAFGSYALFDIVGVKGDLGALIVGAMLASHKSAGNMSKKLMSLKDLLLVGFFLSIGTTGNITWMALLVAFVLAIFVLIKVVLYILILNGFRIRVRTSFLTSINLANYSEFGLIVGSVALANGWLSSDWLVIIALSLTMTFIIAAPLNEHSRNILMRIKKRLKRYERAIPLKEDRPLDIGNARIAIIGMDRLGTGAYDRLRAKYGAILIGTDANPDVVKKHQNIGRNAVLADVLDEEFWDSIKKAKVRNILLAMHDVEENLAVARLIKDSHISGEYHFAVIDRPEQEEMFKDAGVDTVWNIDIEAGRGFAEEVIRKLGDKMRDD